MDASKGQPPKGEITELLRQVGKPGDNSKIAPQLVTLLYRELRILARRQLRRANHTMQVTELVHEAYLRLIDQDAVDWKNRAHFLAIASTLMRRIVMDHARRRTALKRGGFEAKLSLDEALVCSDERSEALLLLDRALSKLETLDPRRSKVVELHVFGGLSNPEMAAILGRSARTVERDWKFANAWLKREITSAP